MGRGCTACIGANEGHTRLQFYILNPICLSWSPAFDLPRFRGFSLLPLVIQLLTGALQLDVTGLEQSLKSDFSC